MHYLLQFTFGLSCFNVEVKLARGHTNGCHTNLCIALGMLEMKLLSGAEKNFSSKEVLETEFLKKGMFTRYSSFTSQFMQ